MGRCLSGLCPVSILSHSVESCGTCLTRTGVVFHNINLLMLKSLNFVCKHNRAGGGVKNPNIRTETNPSVCFCLKNLSFAA